MSRWELDELEYEHQDKLRTFREIEDTLEEQYYQFKNRSQELMERVSHAYREVSYQEGAVYLHQLQENFDIYHHDYYQKRELIEEARNEEDRYYRLKVEEVEEKLRREEGSE